MSYLIIIFWSFLSQWKNTDLLFVKKFLSPFSKASGLWNFDEHIVSKLLRQLWQIEDTSFCARFQCSRTHCEGVPKLLKHCECFLAVTCKKSRALTQAFGKTGTLVQEPSTMFMTCGIIANDVDYSYERCRALFTGICSLYVHSQKL